MDPGFGGVAAPNGHVGVCAGRGAASGRLLVGGGQGHLSPIVELRGAGPGGDAGRERTIETIPGQRATPLPPLVTVKVYWDFSNAAVMVLASVRSKVQGLVVP